MSLSDTTNLDTADRQELIETVSELQDRIDGLEENFSDEIDTKSLEQAKIRSRVHDLESQEPEYIEELKRQMRETENRIQREVARLKRRVSNIEGELGFESQDVIALAEGGSDALRKSDLSLLVEEGPQAVADNSSETLYRAEILASNWIRWGKSKHDRDGQIVERTLASRRDDLLTRLEDARNENLSWKQLHRTMKKIAELGPENIYLSERSDWGKTLVQDCRDDGEGQ